MPQNADVWIRTYWIGLFDRILESGGIILMILMLDGNLGRITLVDNRLILSLKEIN